MFCNWIYLEASALVCLLKVTCSYFQWSGSCLVVLDSQVYPCRSLLSVICLALLCNASLLCKAKCIVWMFWCESADVTVEYTCWCIRFIDVSRYWIICIRRKGGGIRQSSYPQEKTNVGMLTNRLTNGKNAKREVPTQYRNPLADPKGRTCAHTQQCYTSG